MEGFSEYHRKSLSAVKEGGEEYLIESIHASFMVTSIVVFDGYLRRLVGEWRFVHQLTGLVMFVTRYRWRLWKYDPESTDRQTY